MAEPGWWRGAALGALWAVLAVLAIPASARADDQGARLAIIDPAYWRNYVDNLFDMVKTPFALDAGVQARNALVVGATGGLIFALDTKIKRFAQDHRSKLSDNFASVGDEFGTVELLGGASLGLYGVGEALQDRRMRNAGLLSLESLALTGLATEAFKRTVGRTRPNHTNSAQDFHGPGLGGNDSFPSGHTSSAFAVASSLAESYPDSWAVPVSGYGLAALTGFARINDNKHWASDVLFGAALGYGVGKLVHAHSPFGPDGPVAILPFAEPGSAGINLAIRF
jgi:membrane-associated phospholipid phosphatase